MLSGLQHGRENQSNVEHQTSKMERQQADLTVVREVFSSRKFPSMIAAIKQAVAIYANDPEWARVRPPLVELTTEQTKLLAEQLGAIGFKMNGIRRE
jgi:4-hydroxy-tetrahydrodipicolinate synthase